MHDGRFPVEVVTGVPIMTAPAEIDITNAPGLRSALLEAAAQGHGTLVADMTQTRFCDCSGLHALLTAHERALAAGGDLLVVLPGTPASRPVLRIFAITGADRIIPCFTSLDQALAHTRRNGSRASRRAESVREAVRPAERAPRSTAPADFDGEVR